METKTPSSHRQGHHCRYHHPLASDDNSDSEEEIGHELQWNRKEIPAVARRTRQARLWQDNSRLCNNTSGFVNNMTHENSIVCDNSSFANTSDMDTDDEIGYMIHV